jgi:hypothetical protein
MDKHGLSADALISKHLFPLLHATQTKICAHHGKVKSAVEVVDNRARLDALDIAARIHGMYAPVKLEETKKQTVSVIVLDVPRPKREVQPQTVVRLANPIEIDVPIEPKIDSSPQWGASH